MKLNELLAFNDIVIQCHDNPDADALASGYALLKYLRKNGKDARFIYRGRNRITKSNLRIMMDELEIPVTYEPEFDKVPELLVNVDCQYGQRNVTTTPAKNIAIIDHHKTTTSDLPELNEIRSNIGSCATAGAHRTAVPRPTVFGDETAAAGAESVVFAVAERDGRGVVNIGLAHLGRHCVDRDGEK